MRSSPSLNRKLLASRLFGPILHDWQVRGGVKKDVKIKAVVLVALVVASTTAFGNPPLSLAAVVITLAGVGIFVIWRLPVVHVSSSADSSVRGLKS